LYGKFIDRYLGHENRNKNTSKLPTLSACLVCGMFLTFLAVSAPDLSEINSKTKTR